MSATTNNLNSMKNPDIWLKNVNDLIRKIKTFIPPIISRAGPIQLNILIPMPKNINIKNNGDIDTTNIKVNLDKINSNKDTINSYLKDIDKYLLIQPKPTEINNKNNEENISAREIRLNKQKADLLKYMKSLDNNKQSYIKSITEKINTYISNTYTTALNIQKNNLTTINNRIKELFDSIESKLVKSKLENNNISSINTSYKALSQIELKKNINLQTKFNNLKNSLTTSLINIRVNTNSVKTAFNDYYKQFNNNSANLIKKRTNIKKNIGERILMLNENINKKTETLKTFISSITDKINALTKITAPNNKNVFKFSNEQLTSLTNIIAELNKSVKDSNAAFVAENDKLKAIVASLKTLIGNKNVLNVNANPFITNTKIQSNSNSNGNGNGNGNNNGNSNNNNNNNNAENVEMTVNRLPNNTKVNPNNGTGNGPDQVQVIAKNNAMAIQAVNKKANSNSNNNAENVKMTVNRPVNPNNSTGNGAAQLIPISTKKIKKLNNSNKNKPFTYKITNKKTQKEIMKEAMYKGRNSEGRIMLKTQNGKTESIGKGHTILNKNIVFRA